MASSQGTASLLIYHNLMQYNRSGRVENVIRRGVADRIERWGRVLRLATLAILLLGCPGLAGAQQSDADRRPLATRADLEALWARMNPEQRSYAEAVALRERLDQGDFQTGDRVVLQVLGDSTLSNTFTVNVNRGLDLPNIGEISLAGILRSELEPHLRSAISRYIRSADLHAESLMRIAVLGQVGRPGFYNVPAVAVLGDVFTAAGGLTPTSDLAKTEARRGGQTFIPRERLQRAITDGRTLDQLNMQSGDEIQVALKSQATASNVLLLVGAIAGALLSIVAVVSLITK